MGMKRLLHPTALISSNIALNCCTVNKVRKCKVQEERRYPWIPQQNPNTVQPFSVVLSLLALLPISEDTGLLICIS